MLLSLTGCSNLKSYNKTYLDYLGTVINIVSLSKTGDNIETFQSDAESILEYYDENFSVYKENSIVYKFNQSKGNEWLEITLEEYKVFNLAISLFNDTEGAYNPAVFLMSDLWGFTDRFSSNYVKTKPYDRDNPKEELPDQEYIDGFISVNNFESVKTKEENGKYYVYKPGNFVEIKGETYYMQIDFGGFLKGYLAGLLSKKSYEYNIDCGYIALSTSSIGILKKDDKGGKWNIQIKDPRDTENTYLTTSLSNAVVSTSGDYELYYEIDGKRYCHIIDTKKGMPVDTNIMSATVIYDYDNNEYLGAKTDAYATAIIVMGVDRAKEFIEEKGLKASFVYLNSDNETCIYKNF